MSSISDLGEGFPTRAGARVIDSTYPVFSNFTSIDFVCHLNPRLGNTYPKTQYIIVVLCKLNKTYICSTHTVGSDCTFVVFYIVLFGQSNV